MVNLLDLLTAADNGALDMALPDGAAARQIRHVAGVTSTALAAAVGVSDRSIFSYERERRVPSGPATQLRLGRVLRYLETDVHLQAAA